VKPELKCLNIECIHHRGRVECNLKRPRFEMKALTQLGGGDNKTRLHRICKSVKYSKEAA